MFLNKYIFGVALLSQATSSDSKCVAGAFAQEIGTYFKFVFQTQISSPPNVVEVPTACSVVGVGAKVCSEEENVKVVVPNATQVLVISEKPVPVNVSVFCVDKNGTSQGQEDSKIGVVFQATPVESAQRKVNFTLEGQTGSDAVKLNIWSCIRSGIPELLQVCL